MCGQLGYQSESKDHFDVMPEYLTLKEINSIEPYSLSYQLFKYSKTMIN